MSLKLNASDLDPPSPHCTCKRHSYAIGLSGENGVTLGSIHANTVALATALVAKRGREPTQCRGAADDELVVPLRLGDMLSDPSSAKREIDKYMKSDCGGGITKAVITGVLHYGYAKGSKNSTRYERSDKDDKLSLTMVDLIVEHLKQVHSLQVRVRSEPNADLDMCFVVFSRHIIDSILVRGSMRTKMDQDTGMLVRDLDHGRVPGQTQLRNDVISMLTSQEMDGALSAPQIKMPCFPMAPAKLRVSESTQLQFQTWGPLVDQWGSVTILYGRLTQLQFASVCANTCMLRGNTTVCTQPVAPLRCAELVQQGLGGKHHLVCATLSEMDAVQSANKPESQLFVTANAQSVQRWGLPTLVADQRMLGSPHNDGWKTVARELENKWHSQLGPGWPADKHISHLTSTAALNDGAKLLVGMHGNVVGVPAADQDKVEAFTLLLATLKQCCGAQMDLSYRKILWGRQSQGTGGNINHGGGRNGVGGTHECDAHDLDKVEQSVLATAVFKQCSPVVALGKLSDFDPVLTGHYCAQAKLATMRYTLSHNDPRYLTRPP